MAGASQEALWFLFRGDLLVFRDGDIAVLSADHVGKLGMEVLFRQEIGVLEGRACWAAEVAPDAGPPEGRVFRDLRSPFSGVSEDFFMFPPLPPGVSIARAMIDGFVAQHG